MLPIRQKNFFTKLLNFWYWTPLSKIHHYLVFINYLRIATLPQSTQTANASMSTATTGKKKNSSLLLIIQQ